MILRNKSDSRKEFRDGLSGEVIVVEAKQTIEVVKAHYDSNSFEVIEKTQKTKLNKEED